MENYYLKCPSCGYLTKIDSINKSWCFNCTELFPNGFKKWKLKNRDGTLEQYQRLICEKYSDNDIATIIIPKNRKLEIKNPTSKQLKRRAYIKEGFPLDRGGFTEWDFDQFKKYHLPVIVGIVILILILILLE